jgi:peptide chain release factor 3
VLDPAEAAAREPDDWPRAREELDLATAVQPELDAAAFAAGRATPVFFGSAVWNFGVEMLLDALLRDAPAPRARPSADGGSRALDAPFSGQVFKVQANMDPRHRDRIAFVRVCSGRFARGMRATNARTGRPFAMAHAFEAFGQERAVVDEAYPGDVVGLVNAGDLRVGDTLFDGPPVTFPPIPVLAPEHFVTARNRDATKHKQFHRGLGQLAEEGVVHLLRRDATADPAPVLGGVGPLQFEVARHRLEHEFGVRARFEPTAWTVARRTDEAGADALRRSGRADVLVRTDGVLLALFTSHIRAARAEQDLPEVVLEQMLER